MYSVYVKGIFGSFPQNPGVAGPAEV